MIAVARRDLPAGLRFIEANFEEQDRPSAKFALVEALGQERLEFIARIPQFHFDDIATPGVPSIDTTAVLQSVCAFWVAKDPAAIVRYVEDLPDGQIRSQLVGVLAETLTEKYQFLEAKQLMEKAGAAAISDRVLVSIASRFRGEDEVELFQWAAQLQERSAVVVFVSLAQTYGRKDNVTSLRKLAFYAPGPAKANILEELGKCLEKNGHGKTLASIQALEMTPEDRAWAVSGALRSASVEDLPGLLEVALKSAQASPREAAARSYVDRMFFLDQQRAIDWTLHSPADLRPTALLGLVASWSAVDVGKSLQWIRNLERGADRDLALKFYAEVLVRRDPAMARAGASEIDDPGMREQILLFLEKQ